MQVQLQGEKEKTCVAASAINALRHFGMDAHYETTCEAMKLPHKPNSGSYSVRAAKWLRRNYPVIAVCSRPPHVITDPWEAALECTDRWESLLVGGYAGILAHQTSAGNAHAVVLYRITRDHGEPLLHCYDSAQRHKNGFHIYPAIDFVWWVESPEGHLSMTKWLELDELHRNGFPIHVTGREAYFVKPAPFEPLPRAPVRGLFRSRREWRKPEDDPVTGDR